jgi:subtilisin
MLRLLAVVCAAGVVLTPIPAPAQSALVAAPYVVSLRPGAGDPARVAAEQAQSFGFTVQDVYQSALSGYAADLTPEHLAALRADPRVASVEADRQVFASGQITPEGIDRVQADISTTAAIDQVDKPRFDVNVAVLDTGIDSGHPDLNVVGGVDCARGKGFADRFGHGTHIAGIIGALDDGVGVVGVAPGARLWAVRVLDEQGQGTLRDLLCGVDWVTSTRTDADPSNDIEVANLSLGGTGGDDGRCGHTDNDFLHQAICRSVAAGVTYVVAAGNGSEDAAGYSPASYDEVITVSALADADGRPGGLGGSPACRADEDDTLANFSNYGPDVDLIAPGVCILSTVPKQSVALGRTKGYGVLSGTSFAAPHVTGAAVLYLAQNPGASPATVRQALIAAGSSNWDNSDDPDGIKEPLVDVEAF